jgi:flagellar basal-body rod protein FlgC
VSLFRSLDISATGLTAGRVRMDVIAQNIANVETGADGGAPYQRQEVVLVSAGGSAAPVPGTNRSVEGGVVVQSVRQDTSPAPMVYKPEDPAADANGYVRMPNVNLPLEMVDMVAATRAYEANAAALRAGRQMISRALDIMR